MKSVLIILLLLPIYTCIWGQKAQRQIEVASFLHFDQYPEFTYSYNSVTTNQVKIKGLSWGTNLAYKQPLSKKVHIKGGIGYYKYSFNDIEAYNSRGGQNNTRVINYLSDVYVMFRTQKYWYHCLAAHVGVDETFELKKRLSLIVGLSFTDYYTFSQYYHIDYDYPAGPPQHKYKLNNLRNFAFSAGFHAGLLKEIGNVNIGPIIRLPVYSTWKQDDTFPAIASISENNADNRSKWFKELGLGISCNYSLSKK
jgi:hypothetical protein